MQKRSRKIIASMFIALVLTTAASSGSAAQVRRHAAARRSVAALGAPIGSVLLSAPFNGVNTTANRYVYAGSTCVTAGTNPPSSSVPACGTTAPKDAAASGVLQLTPPYGFSSGFLAGTPAFSTSAGLVVTFTDYSFGGTSTGADGVVFFLSDAAKALPTTSGQSGGSLGYANGMVNGTLGSGVTGAYLGIGLDEYGNFSSPTEGRLGGPGLVPETIAVRGAAASGWQYLTGVTGNGIPASLPFTLNTPAAPVRPLNAPTIQITLTASGVLSVAVDIHDGNGFRTEIPATTIVGLNGQPAMPSSVHFGFTSSTGGLTSRHQISDLTIATMGSNAPAPALSSQDNITYHNNNSRTGWYSGETTLTTANVASSAFHEIGTLFTAGKSYSQPLYLSAQTIADGSQHNVLIITDASDVVYAFDADTLELLWLRDFKGNGVRQQLSSDISCDDNWPNMGINGTPVVDRTRNRMYVVVPTNDNGTAHLRLHALSLTNGSDAVAPVEVAATETLASGGTASTDPNYNFNRAGLLESNNTIYVPLTTHCDYDTAASHGWVLSYNPDTLAAGGGLTTTDKNIGNVGGSSAMGGVWQGGFGIAADASGNLFFATGNGPNDDGGSDYAMSVLELPPSLNIAQRSFFTPSTWAADSQADNDLASGGVMLLPDQPTGAYPHLAIAGGKTGMKYLLNRDKLGGLNTVDQIPWEQNTGGGIWGGPAYFVDSSGNQKIIYGGTPTLNAYTLITNPTYALSYTTHTTVGVLEGQNAGVSPIVSSNGETAGSAIVWAVKTPSGGATGTGNIALYAFNAANLGTTLFSASAGQWTTNGDTGGAMITPLVANGRVYLASDGIVTVWGVK